MTDQEQNASHVHTPSSHIRAKLFQSIQKRLNERRTRRDKIADGLVAWVGTFHFAVLHGVIFVFWIVANLELIPGIATFDPFPFNFLTLIVSLEAIFLSIFVLISQNRESKIADLRQEFDVQVNMIAEREITKIIHLLAHTMHHLNVPHKEDSELKEMMRPLNIEEIRFQLEEQLDLPKETEERDA